MSAGMIHSYPVTATEIKDTSFVDVDQDLGSGNWESQKLLGSTFKDIIRKLNIEQKTVSEMQALALANGFIGGKRFIIDSADGGDRKLLVMCAYGVTNQLYQTAIDMTTGEISTYDLATDDFINSSGTYTTTITPDGTVVRTANPENSYYTRVGNISNVSILIGDVECDFSAGSTGQIQIDTFPFLTSSLILIGNANIELASYKAGGGSKIPFISVDKNGLITIFTGDETTYIGPFSITVTFQYEIN